MLQRRPAIGYGLRNQLDYRDYSQEGPDRQRITKGGVKP